MGRFIRRLLMGAAVVWGVKSLQDKRREWSGRSSTEIRQEVISKLPATMDEESKQRVADKVVQAVKSEETESTRPEPSTASTTPPPETPMSTPSGSGAPPPPPAGQEDTT